MADSLKMDGVLEFGYGIVGMAAVADRRLSSTAFRLYAALQNFARQGSEAFPSQKTLADLLDVEVPTVSNLTSELVDYGYIKKSRDRKNGGLTYTMMHYIDVEVEKDLFGDYITGKKKKPKKETKKKADPRVRELQDYYTEKFEGKGESPDYNFSRDNGIFKKYLEKHDVDKMKHIIDAYFECDWGEKVGYTVPGIKTIFNKLILDMAENKKADGFGFNDKTV